MSWPELIHPDNNIVFLKKLLTSEIKEIGFSVPPCPPAPAETTIIPSTPASAAFSACLFLIISWYTNPPYEWTAPTSWETAPSDVIMIGTLCFTHIIKSSFTLGLVLWTIRLTPKGAAFFPVSFSNSSNSFFIWITHSSKPSVVLWFNAGNVPTIPFLQHSTTSLGPEIKNIGAATAGIFKSEKKSGLLIVYIFNINLPIFSPLNNFRNISWKFSIPSYISSLAINSPFNIQSLISFWAEA